MGIRLDGRSSREGPVEIAVPKIKNQNAREAKVAKVQAQPKTKKATDQQEPHCPWFLTGVTAPLFRQSTVASGPPGIGGSSTLDVFPVGAT